MLNKSKITHDILHGSKKTPAIRLRVTLSDTFTQPN